MKKKETSTNMKNKQFSYVIETMKTSPNIMEAVAKGSAELFGTAILVFIIAASGSVYIHDVLPPFQSFMAAGMAVLAAIHCFGNISGAHINPVTTLAAIVMKQIAWYLVPVYFIAQMAGSTIGYGLFLLITPANYTSGIGMTVISPSISLGQAVAVEIIISTILTFANCACWDPRSKHLIDSVAIRFGLIITGINFAAAPYTGASMNPARSFGPALWNNDWTDQWVYWVCPLGAALMGSLYYRFVLIEWSYKPVQQRS